jgi:3D (Asp-Asp-Asp) domain-containing protein
LGFKNVTRRAQDSLLLSAMKMLPIRDMALRLFFLCVVIFSLSACSTRRLPKYERPLPKTQFQKVRTTAYTHTESDHLEHGRKTAIGTTLQCGPVSSAAADWSRWPVGTVFRICSTGDVCRVDDIGWALAGRNTIDLYKTCRSDMNRWGLRNEEIEILQWGSLEESLRILKPRTRYPHVKRMVNDIQKQI